MDRIAIKSDNAPHIARYILAPHHSILSYEYQSQWLRNQQRLQKALDQFLEHGNPFPEERFIDFFDRSLYARVTCTRHLTDELPENAWQTLPIIDRNSKQTF